MQACRAGRLFFDQQDRGQIGAPLQDVRALAARRRAAIQHPVAGPDIEQVHGQLGREILHRDPPGGKAGQLRHGTGPFKQQGLGRQGGRFGVDIMRAEPF